MFNNTFTENWGDAAYGLFLKEISDSYIFGNKFSRIRSFSPPSPKRNP